MSSARTRAWVMDVGAGRRVAAGTHHVVEYLLSPNTIGLPLAPAHCPAVLIWREQIIPSVNLAGLSSSAQPGTHEWRGAVVLAYQEEPGKPLRYGALLVYAAPEETWVSDDMACPLPEESTAFQYFTSACFAHEEQAVPVVDTTKLFSESPPEVPSSNTDETEHVSDAVETTRATPAESDPPEPSEESVQALEQELFAAESSPEIAEQPAASVEDNTEVEWPEDASLFETDSSREPVAPLSETQADALEQMAPATEASADTDHTEAVAEVSSEERAEVQQQEAQEESDIPELHE